MKDHYSVRRIVLVGFMGAGKSTVGALLARSLGWKFADADAVIEQQQQTSIAGLFSQYGEEGFRRIEADAIQALCHAEELVLALGGGAVETASTRELLNSIPHTCIVFLEAPMEVMLLRCEQQPNAAVRPVLRERGKLLERLAARLPHYRSAHLTVSTSEVTVDDVVARILGSLNETFGIGCIQPQEKDTAL